jgi:hypothetical protein
MTSRAAPKSGPLNWLEGAGLTAVLQGFPIFAAASLMVKLLGDDGGGSRVPTVIMATLVYTVLVIWLGTGFPKLKNGYEKAFFDASLSFSDKIARWRARPATTVQLMASVLLLSLLAVCVA